VITRIVSRCLVAAGGVALLVGAGFVTAALLLDGDALERVL
jgi:hypothetical protein